MKEKDDISVFDLLGFDNGVIDVRQPNHGLSSNKAWLIKEIRQKEFDIDHVYFSGDFPTIYFKKVPDFGEATIGQIRELHRKVWNQGKVAFLYVGGPAELRIYNCYYRPINPYDSIQNISDAELCKARFSDERNLEELVEVFGKVSIESGQFWKAEKFSEKLYQKRVNQVLIDNLKHTRRVLHNKYGIENEIIHDLLLRSLFVLYLEDRGATGKGFYTKFAPGARSYYDLLENSLDGTYVLFQKLEGAFNGNLSPITPKEKESIRPEHLKLICECFWDKLVLDGQQRLFDWKAFDFKYIPIELLSEIYENFLAAEEGDSKKSDDGAYYTPHTLVEFILNKVLPWGKENEFSYNCKVLDPTCGSGIFLVESFKRLIDRWECQYPEKQIGFDDLKKILMDNIFGIEYNSEAIKVTAFSLYLAMLDKLEPKTLWKDKRFPYLIYDPGQATKKTRGNNLFLMSSLSDGPFCRIDFDLIIGNPPFKEGRLDAESKKYLKEKEYPQEKLIAFLDRALQLCPNGRIALVAASKPLLFNQGSTYRRFRQSLFNEAYVEEIYNFSILRKTTSRHGGNLFASASGPTSVIFYRKKSEGYADRPILYCAPKTAFKNNLIDGLAIDQSDVRFLPREECANPASKIWKIAMWGSQRDFTLIRRLADGGKSIGEELAERGWQSGRGFEISPPCNKKNDDISKMPFIEAKRLDRYCIADSSFSSIRYKKFRRLGAIEAYKGPHILLKKGLQNNRICASFTKKDCSFTDAILGISAPRGNEKLLQGLTLFLNSGFATYLIFLTSSAWGIERENIMANESFSLPGLLFNVGPDVLAQLSDYFQKIKLLNETLVTPDGEMIQLEKEIDKYLYELFQLSEYERSLIEDFLQYGLDLFVSGERSLALKKATNSEIERYTQFLSRSINELLEFGGQMHCWARIYNLSNSPLQMVAVVFNTAHKAGYIEKMGAAPHLNDLLIEIERHTYEKHSESIYFRKIIKYYKGDTLYLLKPNEKRFWSRSAALNDADEIVLETINS
jgi:hypothetical protein